MNTNVVEKEEKSPKVLFVDDERSILKSLERFGRSQGWSVTTANSGSEAISYAEESEFDVVISDMRMPEMNGAQLLKTFEQRFPSTIRVLLTGYSDIETLGAAINEGHVYNYLTKPWNESLLTEVVSEALTFCEAQRERDRIAELKKIKNAKLGKVALLLDKRVKERTIEVDQALQLLKSSHDKSQEALLDSVAVINRILEWKEGHSHGQSKFVTYYAVQIAKRLNFSETDVESIRLAALMHRVGMLALPDEIRSKPMHALSREELKIYKQYPLWGERSIKHSIHLKSIAKIVRHHREYINGNGYPDGLILREIPLAAQVVGLVSDFYDAFSGQVDKRIRGVSKAKTYIQEWAGKRHDVGLVDLLWLVLDDFCDTTLQTCVLSTSDLSIDMILDENIVSSNGTLLLAKNTLITSAHISKLVEYETCHREIFEITIRVPSPPKEEQEP